VVMRAMMTSSTTRRCAVNGAMMVSSIAS
jgi:hypothetical protein